MNLGEGRRASQRTAAERRAGGREAGKKGGRASREGHEGNEGVAVNGEGLNEGQGQLDVAEGGPEEEGDEGLREGGRVRRYDIICKLEKLSGHPSSYGNRPSWAAILSFLPFIPSFPPPSLPPHVPRNYIW